VQPAIQVHGHRGARALRPENTLAAFEYAIAAGADFLEMDVAVTRDDVVVVTHDLKLNRRVFRPPGGPRVIRKLTLAELQRYDCGALRNLRFRRQIPEPGSRIPTLDQVLELAHRGGVRFNIEIKSVPERPELTPPPAPFAELVWNVIRRHRLEKRVMVQSFDFRMLVAMRALAPEIRLSALYVGRPKDLALIARQAGADMVGPYHALATRRRVAAAHDAGFAVVPWTANRRRDWRRLIAAGVDGIITDDPAGLIAYLQLATAQ